MSLSIIPCDGSGRSERSRTPDVGAPCGDAAYLYAGAVKFQAQSLLAPDPPEAPAGFSDLRSAARQARAAEMALYYAEEPERRNLEAAIERFQLALPDLVSARNMLEHFDDYLAGKGRKPRVYDVRFKRAGPRYVVHVGELCIDAATASEEARHLSGNAIATAGSDWGYPVGNEFES